MPADKIAPAHMGEIWPAAEPAANPAQYGWVDFSPTGAFEVRSLQTFQLVYTAGPYGIDDTGALRVLFRFATDGGKLQVVDPAAENYVSAVAGNGVALDLSYAHDALPRPRYHGLTIIIKNGYLCEGDTITITFGDTSGGSPGMRLQSFCESHFEFKVVVDIHATRQFIPVANSPAISIVPAEPVRWKAVAPTLRRPGEEFSLGLKAEDNWGNPTDRAAETIMISANLPVEGLPQTIDYPTGRRAVRLDELRVRQEGILRIRIHDHNGRILADANPVVIKKGAFAGYWGDLHGQSGESVGVGSAREYFDFARDLAFLDVAAHQANDFQINNAFWRHLNNLTAEYNRDGKFVVLPGYEWSGNTCIGGDRNVYFRHEDRRIRRSSHALLPDRSDIDMDSPTARNLFRDLAHEDCIVFAHCGGRYADVRYAHDPRLETSMEIHSAWGTFEWLIEDCFQQGYRCGVVCNSDGHKGRPGASHPGAASFAAYGGLTCFYADTLSRDALFDSIRRRHTYGTTGNRMHLDVRVGFQTAGRRYDRDPRQFETVPQEVAEVMMGDIVQTDDKAVNLMVEAVSHTPIDRIDVLNGMEAIQTFKGYTQEDIGSRIRVVWSGAEYRGRGNRTHWQGRARFEGCTIQSMAAINNWNPERRFEIRDNHTIIWDSRTAGNFCGFDVWLNQAASGRLHLSTNLVSDRFDLTGVGFEDIVLEAGGLRRQVRISRLPDRNHCLEIRKTAHVSLKPAGDNPLWVRVTTEDGHRAWSSPVYVYRA
ncbi:MAG: DUF3604 domain-containing protein [Desulfobacterales bacterium]|nr:MAG: DUF3604 domain-containing protein [Desulfobacterales bacterium]